MKLMSFLSGQVGIDLDEVSLVHLLLDVLVNLKGNFRFGINLVMECLDSLGGSKKVFLQVCQLLIVQEVDQNLVANLVH